MVVAKEIEQFLPMRLWPPDPHHHTSNENVAMMIFGEAGHAVVEVEEGDAVEDVEGGGVVAVVEDHSEIPFEEEGMWRVAKEIEIGTGLH